MKTRIKIVAKDDSHEVAIVLSVRSNQPGMGARLAHFEHRNRFDSAINRVVAALQQTFNVREIKIGK